jgi:hypothetical protein
LTSFSSLVGGEFILGNLAIGENGGLTRAGDAEKSDAEPDGGEIITAALGCFQGKRVTNTRYGTVLWEEHWIYIFPRIFARFLSKTK